MGSLRRRSHALGLHTWALVTLAAGALAAGACSDDDPGPGPSGSAGEGGEAEGGSGGSAGTAAKPGGAAGMPDEGGAAGMPPLPPAGEVCSACGTANCGDEVDACVNNPECAPWLACLGVCESEACIEACDEEHADVARIYRGVYDCLDSECKDDCAVAKPGDKSECVDDDVLPATDVVPQTLAETGLYAGYTVVGGEGGAGGAGGASGMPVLDPGTDALTLAPYVRGFEPKYPLWADGATKDRYIYIPKCSTIDTSDMDHWRFPVGTRLWKHFTVPGDGVGSGRVETRMMHHFGPGEADWLFAGYQWDASAPDDPAAAIAVPAGVVTAGLGHDIPNEGQCQNCHTKLSERVLGFGAFQLSHEPNGDDLTIAKISHWGWLTDPAPLGFEVPGTPVQQAALGYLHGNCGGCHNQGQGIGAGPPNDNTPLVLRLITTQDVYASTDIVTSSVDLLVASGMPAITGKPRIDPMAPDTSAILLRMKDRGTALQMPPLVTTSTKLADTDGGVADVTAWINSIQ